MLNEVAVAFQRTAADNNYSSHVQPEALRASLNSSNLLKLNFNSC
jgi:hypothetical protein